ELHPGGDRGTSAAEEVGNVVGGLPLLDEFNGTDAAAWSSSAVPTGLIPEVRLEPAFCSVGQAGVSRHAPKQSARRIGGRAVRPQGANSTGLDEKPSRPSLRS